MSEPAHILVVDASDYARPAIVQMLEVYGYRVSTADAATPMRCLLTGLHGIDAVVLDATISGQGADSLALYAKKCGLPLVMISGHPDHMAFAHAHGLQLLWKPFRQNDLHEAVERALASGIPGQRDA